MDHSSENPGGVLDRLSSAELNLAGREEKGVATKFPDAYLETHAGASRGLGKKKPPALTGQRLGSVTTSYGLEVFGQSEDLLDLGCGKRLNGEKVLHGKMKTGRVIYG
jgi:hypothetical protein